MAGKMGKTRKQAGGAADGAKKQTEAAVSKGKQEVERQARQVGVRGMLREFPYAGLGLGRVVVDAVRDVEATSLPERLRDTPGAVVSKVSKQGPNLKVGYLVLAARGRGERLKSTGQETADATAKQGKSAAKKTKAAAKRTKAAASTASKASRPKAGKDGA
jgi:hypothetical protein